MGISEILLYAITLLIVWQMALYPTFCYAIYRLLPPLSLKDYSPFLTVIVPVYNEERSLATRIKNIEEEGYPHLEVIIVESGSSDKTYEIALDLQKDYENVRVIREGVRRGKASAIAAAQGMAQGEIIVITDANAFFGKNALQLAARHFSKDNVGGVDGRLVMPAVTPGIPHSSSFYWTLEYMMRCGESRLDSTCTMHGGFSAIRKGIVNPDASIISEDLDMALQIRKKGLTIAYEPQAIVFEKAASTPTEQIIQKKKNVIGTLLCTGKHRDMFLPPRNLYSLLIYPSHKMLPLLLPFMFLSLPLFYAILGGEVMKIHLLFFASLYIVSNMALLALMPAGEGLNLSLNNIAKIYLYFLLQQYIVLLAWKDFLTGNYSALWEKVESTR